jgi:hypothetical protein
VDKDTPIECQNSELDRNECDVVEMAENIIALAYHHLAVFRYIDDVPTHAV